MDVYAGAATAVQIHYPVAATDAQYVAEELAARLDELASDEPTPFTDQLFEGIATGDTEAIYVGLQADWGAPWWVTGNDFGIKVVSDLNCINSSCTGHEFHIIARDYPLLLRAIWITLNILGWRHYMPNGVEGLEDLWTYKAERSLIRTRLDRVWTGAVDHPLESIAGGTSNLRWSEGTDHGAITDPNDPSVLLHPNGLREGNLMGAIGYPPVVESHPAGSWLRHMGWTSSASLQSNAAWRALTGYGDPDELAPWDVATEEGQYTPQFKLHTDSTLVQQVAVDYANDKVALGREWVSLARPDGDLDWEIDFGDLTFGAKLPVRRQIELANHVATSTDFTGTGILIHAYGRTAETPSDEVWPDASRVCVLIIEGYRPAGKSIEDIIDDYVEEVDDGLGGTVRTARCPIGLYQYLYSGAWGIGVITAKAGNPALLVESANRVRYLPNVSPKVLTGEAMTDFGLYGLGYYCYMRLILNVGRVTSDFTEADFARHRRRFQRNMFPTPPVRTAIRHWYNLLLDLDHKPLLSSHLVRCLWDELEVAMAETTADSDEEKRIVELCKYTRYLDLRNRFEAAEVEGVDSEAAYDIMMEWLFRTRDSGLVDVVNFFQFPLRDDHHAVLGLDTIFVALNEPPGDNRGANGDRMEWTTTPPLVAEFKGSDATTNWIIEGVENNNKHGLTETTFSTELVAGEFVDSRPLMYGSVLRPYHAEGKMRLWLIPQSATFECRYNIHEAPAYVEFVHQLTGDVHADFVVDWTVETQQDATDLFEGELYEIRLTTYATGDRFWIDWSGFTQRHYVTFDPGQEGDPSGFQDPLDPLSNLRSLYFLVSDGVTDIHFYASHAEHLQLFLPDGLGTGGEVEDTTFAPVSRAYQSHPVSGTGRRVLRIAGMRINDLGFWLLNCPNLFALHPSELIRPADV